MKNSAKGGKQRKNVLFALSWYHPKLHAGVAEFAKEHNWHLNTSLALYSSRIPDGWQGDGVIRQTHFANDSQKAFFESLDLPCAILGESEEYPSVRDDHVGIARMALKHLMEQNYHHFAGYCPLKRGFRVRMDTFRMAVEEAGYDCPILVPKETLDWNKQREWLAKALRALPKPVGIWTESDQVAADLIEVCLDYGIDVPEDVGILGVRNDKLICESLGISLSSVENNLFGVGYEAASLLQRVFDGETLRGHHVIIPPRGVAVRASTDIIASDASIPGLRRALQVMADEFNDPELDCDRVARLAGVSRRSLFNAFKKGVGRTPHSEILRRRMNEARRLLISYPNMALEDVAERCGYPILRSFFSAFKRYFGKTPKDVREGGKMKYER